MTTIEDAASRTGTARQAGGGMSCPGWKRACGVILPADGRLLCHFCCRTKDLDR